jgi:hypothetical protein
MTINRDGIKMGAPQALNQLMDEVDDLTVDNIAALGAANLTTLTLNFNTHLTNMKASGIMEADA